MSTPPVIDVTAATFDEEVIARSHQVPVVVDFWADWCGPCKMLGPVLESLATQAQGDWVLAKIDTDANQALAQSHRIRGIPAVKAFVDGEVVAEFTGVQAEPWLRQWLANLAPSVADNHVASARAAWAEADAMTARAHVQAALGEDPAHAGALVMAAVLWAQDGDLDTAQQAIDRLSDADIQRHAAELSPVLARIQSGGRSSAEWLAALEDSPDDLDTQWGAAHALAADGDVEHALKLLLGIVRRTRSYRDDGARKAMLKLFGQVGDRSPLASKYRRKLEMTLF